VGNTFNTIPQVSHKDGSPPQAWGIQHLTVSEVKAHSYPFLDFTTKWTAQHLTVSEVKAHYQVKGLIAKSPPAQHLTVSEVKAQHGSPPQAWGILLILPQKQATSPVHPHRRGEYLC